MFTLILFIVKGVYEALELRDGGSDYLGKGVLKVCGLFVELSFLKEDQEQLRKMCDMNNLRISLFVIKSIMCISRKKSKRLFSVFVVFF